MKIQKQKRKQLQGLIKGGPKPHTLQTKEKQKQKQQRSKKMMDGQSEDAKGEDCPWIGFKTRQLKIKYLKF